MSFDIKSSTLFCSRVFKHKNNDCTICRQSLEEDSIYAKEDNLISELITSQYCGHTFHKECIEPWLQKYNKCPICAEKWH
tara:strand:+ start:850 stop:1089 length:240 start_codon:yes stop_codon:yes gene_type:complete